MAPLDVEKQQIVDTCQSLVGKGYLMATGGNVSMRLAGQSAFIITPSNYDYMIMTPEDICVLDFDLQVLEGRRMPSVESAMHAAIYQVRGDVNAIVHTHQAYASALALINAPIPALFDEQVRFLGRRVEIIPYAPSSTGLLKNTVARHVKDHYNAYLMKNHGALIFGHDMLRAVNNVEVLEKCALAYLLALCTERKVTKIPLPIQELVFAKLRKDQKKVEVGQFKTASE